MNVGELVRVIREAALSRTEIQILTDALLNKHHDPLPEHSEWTEVSPTISNYSKSYFFLKPVQSVSVHAQCRVSCTSIKLI